MGLRFRKSVKICKGVRVNFGKTGASVSVGTKGLHYTAHTSGRRTTSIGIPGTGLSYVSSSGGRRKKRSQSYQFPEHEKCQTNETYVENCSMVDDYNELIDQITTLHEQCSEKIDWEAIKNEEAPFDMEQMGPNEKRARQEYDDYKPSFLGKFIPSLDDKRMQELENKIIEGRDEDQRIIAEWGNRTILASKILRGNIDKYFEVISEVDPFKQILDFGSDFEIGTDDPSMIEVEFHAKTQKVVPNHVPSLTKTGKVSSKPMTKTNHFDIAQDYICSCVLRVAREMFALLPIETVIIHVVDTIENSAGDSYTATVLSVLIHRNQLEYINFDMIDPSDLIETFQCNMTFKKTQGFKPVSRIEFSSLKGVNNNENL